RSASGVSPSPPCRSWPTAGGRCSGRTRSAMHWRCLIPSPGISASCRCRSGVPPLPSPERPARGRAGPAPPAEGPETTDLAGFACGDLDFPCASAILRRRLMSRGVSMKIAHPLKAAVVATALIVLGAAGASLSQAEEAHIYLAPYGFTGNLGGEG